MSASLALEKALAGVQEPAIGRLATDHVQIAPQNRGTLTIERARGLQVLAPSTQFRLHASVEVVEGMRVPWDLADVHRPERFPYFEALAEVSQALGAPAYTLHAGLRGEDYDLEQMAANVLRLSEVFGCRVGVEGLYPNPRKDYLLSTQSEYRWLLESGLDFALDVSHVHIVATAEGGFDNGLLRELLASDHCLEVHVSANDGDRDQHAKLSEPQWWFEAVAQHTHRKAVIFSEGNQRK
jgi:sugar phosphate isomerase/epimerase